MAGARGAGAAPGAAASTSADVLVIGAGASGLTAASRLEARGLSVIVLEGRDRIGGRVWTDHGMGFPLDLGAAWLHGQDDNPLVPMAKKLGLDLVETDWLNTDVHDRNGRRIPAGEVTASHRSFRRVMKRVFAKRERAAPDVTLADAVCESIAEVGVQGRPSLTDWQIAYLEDDYAEELHRLSLRVCKLDEDFHGGDFLLTGGYAPLMESLGRGADVRLRHRVTGVEHGSDPVRVTTTRGTFTARAALCTLPIGVLRPSIGARVAAVAFDPPLPPAKIEAASSFGVALMNKVILRFERPFWTARRDVIGWTGRRHGEFPVFVNAQRLRGVPVLETLVVGDHARCLEPLSDAVTVERTLGALREIFGAGVPQPVAARVTRWGADPFAAGSYSYARAGASLADREVLARPLGDRLFFAGEATHATFSGTVHGAHMTGLAQADRIASALGLTKI